MNLQLAKKNAAVCKVSNGRKKDFLLLGQKGMGSRFSCGASHQWMWWRETEFSNSPDELKGCWRLLTSEIHAARWLVQPFLGEELFMPLQSISEWGQDLSEAWKQIGRSCSSHCPLSCACSVSIPGISSPGLCCCGPLKSHVPIHYHSSLKRKMEMTTVISIPKVYPATCYMVVLNRKTESSVPIISRLKPEMDKHFSGITGLQ